MPKLIYGRGTIAFGLTADPTDQFECQVTDFQVTASANTLNVPGSYCAGPSQVAQQSTFGVSMSYLSDWGQEPSLSQFLWDNDGAEVHFSMVPDDPSVPDVAGTCYAVAGAFGGPGDDIWTATGNLPCPSKPILTPKAP